MRMPYALRSSPASDTGSEMRTDPTNAERSLARVRKRRRAYCRRAPLNAALRLLVVVDSTQPSRRVLDYLGKCFAKQRDVQFCLACLLPRLPAELLESGGAEAPADEERVEAALRFDQDRRMASWDKTSQVVLARSVARLRRAGVRRSAIETCCTSPLDNRTPADEVLIVAKTHDCHTIVVGHVAHSWFRGFGGGHLAEHLVREARGFAVWVID
jgi:nucleotide-binding universal stress UspA family protein